MTYDELVDFIENRMTMSHVYQPVLIRSLVDAGGKATLRQLAQAFLVQDESQLLYYENRIKKMPFPVLRRHGVVEGDGDLVSLTTKKLTLQQKAHVRMLCERKLQEFVSERGLSIWDYRLLESDPVPDSVRYEVLKAADGRCALCGITKKDRPLQVDHIKPRSKGGTNAIENLQALCDECNRAKSNRDETDFRIETASQVVSDCDFCEPKVEGRIVEECESAVAIQDKHPVTQGHLLVLPRRHTPDLFGMVERERLDANNLLRILKFRIQREDSSVTGFNVGMNCGEDAGQTVMHAHIHLIPRRRGDTAKPRGGVRGVIPERMGY
jgi:diadenosine tetraphosphate (Ap4A) HIT family hydrolase